MRHSAAFLVTLVVLAFVGCGRSPASPDSQNPGAPIHDTLNATGSTTPLDGVSSELSGAYDRQWYDDFVSPEGTWIRTVAWQGIRPTARPPASFYIAFIADNDGIVMREYDPTTTRLRALSATTYALAQVDERLGLTRACDQTPQEQCGSYDYSVRLSTPFRVTAGTRYWLLIQAETSFGSMSGWLWRKGRTDNGFSLSNLHLTGSWDMAFTLVP